METCNYFLGVDVGTGSARVGVFDQHGKLLHSKSKEIKIHNPFPGYYEQSSKDIWASVVQLVKVCQFIAMLQNSIGRYLQLFIVFSKQLLPWINHALKELHFVQLVPLLRLILQVKVFPSLKMTPILNGI